MNAQTAQTGTLSTLLGGVEIYVTHSDGSTKAVKVLQLPIKSYNDYLRVLDDELAMADVLCGKEKGWSETLTLLSLEDVIETGEKLNADFFARWLRRRLARQEMLVPGLTQSAIAKASELTTSLPSAPLSVATP